MHEMAITESVVALVSEEIGAERVRRIVLEIREIPGRAHCSSCDALVLNKIDLLPHPSFKVDAFLAHAHRVNPKLRVFPVSAQTGEGLAAWYDWLRELRLDPGAHGVHA